MHARRQLSSGSRKPERLSGIQKPRWHKCGQLGLLARECSGAGKIPGQGGELIGQQPPRLWRDSTGLQCYNCHQAGHFAARCPSKAAMYCQGGISVGKVSVMV